VTENGYVKAGTAVYLGEEGLYIPWKDPSDGGEEEESDAVREGAGLTSHDVKLVSGSNPAVGVLISGHPLESKCTGVTDGFKEEVKGYLRRSEERRVGKEGDDGQHNSRSKAIAAEKNS